MNRYLVVIEKTRASKVSWWGYEIVAEDIEDVLVEIDNAPTIWGDCQAWDIISIHKQWKIGGQMVMEVHTGRL